MWFFADPIKPNQPLARRGLARGIDLMDRVLSQLEVDPGHIERNASGRWRIVIDPLVDTGALAGIASPNGDVEVSGDAKDGTRSVTRHPIEYSDTGGSNSGDSCYSLAGLDTHGAVRQNYLVADLIQPESGDRKLTLVTPDTYTDTIGAGYVHGVLYWQRPGGGGLVGGGRVLYAVPESVDVVTDAETVDTGGVRVLRLTRQRLFVLRYKDSGGETPYETTEDVSIQVNTAAACPQWDNVTAANIVPGLDDGYVLKTDTTTGAVVWAPDET